MIRQAFDRSWIGLGPMVTRFEEEWAAYSGARAAIGVNSATAALHLAIASFRFPEGSRVLLPALTFAATASAVLYNRLIPVFVDSDPVTLGLDLDDLERKFTKDCVAVIPVHYAGHPVPMDRLMPWARAHGMKVIEDCAHTAGTRYKGRTLGTWGDIGCYSFEEKKLMTTGDGGMMVTDDPDLFKEVKAMRWVGIDKDNWRTAQRYTGTDADTMHWFYEISVLGWKYNMNDLAASIGLAQLKKLPAMNAHRSRMIRAYLDAIAGIPGVDPLLPFEPETCAYQMFGIRTDRSARLMAGLKSRGIATGRHYTPLGLQPLFAPWGGTTPFVDKEHERFITLPLHADLTLEEVRYVTDAIAEVAAHA